MLNHTVKMIYRNILRNKTTFFINLIGLSTGLTCALLIYLWVNDELNVDKFHEKDSQLYQVMQNYPLADNVLTIDATPGILSAALLKEIPEIEDAAVATRTKNDRGGKSTRGILSVENHSVKATELYVSRNFFNVFSYALIEGERDQVLTDKYSVLLSDELAMKLFNTTENLIGKTVIWNQQGLSGDYVISGIFKKPPVNSSEQFDLLFNYEMWLENHPYLQIWGNSGPRTYVVLREHADIDLLNRKIADFMRTKHQAGSFFLQRYSDNYLYNHFENGVQAGGRIDYIRLFSIVAVFILAIACINFMNLSTARASQRHKEVGVKKAVGAGRKTLIAQYLGESLSMAFFALLVAIVTSNLLLPQFNEITGKHLHLQFDPKIIFSVLLITIFTGLISGSYPAFYLSGFSPTVVLKGKIHTTSGENWIRKGLVVFQFATTCILIVSVLVVYKQMAFVHAKNLGYNKDNIITFKSDGKLNEGQGTFLNEVRNMSGVVGASSFGHDLTGNHGGTSGVVWPGKSPNQKIEFGNLEVDYGLMELFGFEMVTGRTFSREFAAEESKIIFNQAAIDAMELSDPIGKTIKLWGHEKQIVGVVKNFNFESLYEEVKPCFLQCHPNQPNILVKIKSGMENETIARIRDFYGKYNPGFPFEYRFIDDDYQALYASEQRVAVLSRYSAEIAILISCLGLFGLAAFTVERRRKEIGIRKVLGSSEFGIIRLLSGDFSKLVITAILLALPVSYFIAKNWIESFAYRIDLGIWYFVGAAFITLTIAWLTVGAQAVRAAFANPVEALRNE